MASLEEIRKAKHDEWLRRQEGDKEGKKRARDESITDTHAKPSSVEVDISEESPAASATAPKRLRIGKVAQSLTAISSTLKILTWNVDGLDQHSDEIDMTARTMSVAAHIAEQRPQIVLLQELVDFNLQWFKRLLSEFYDFYIQSSPALPYFVGILIDRSAVCVKGPLITDNFSTTKMGRALVSLTGAILLPGGNRINLHVATAHLESTKSFGKARIEQLKESFADLRRSVAENGASLAIFGGDLNIRDNEVREALQVGSGEVDIKDSWEACGRPKDAEFTWDMRRNDNLGLKGKPKARFDRLYFAHCEELKICPMSFKLVGTERCDLDEIKGKKRFPSDHFGIEFELKIDKKVIDLSDDS
ncbi:Tyrosyl-DNA phosphodiesterase 2 [Perkinsus chesapeaki]|uniref:Tyrosyl-DNA phosphodiesterase 2 n=1 Tax=Perkinsus chesapeaki TaxID=330153 RepID=A0A7J6LVM7_PERCH|nr:Tyrosyl-DNA phosphodiesterase 2 [Perkinsus chesapeaki]